MLILKSGSQLVHLHSTLTNRAWKKLIENIGEDDNLGDGDDDDTDDDDMLLHHLTSWTKYPEGTKPTPLHNTMLASKLFAQFVQIYLITIFLFSLCKS